MKKMISIILCVTLVFGTLSLSGCSCVQKLAMSSLSGKEIAKLLLANSRLDANDLSVGLQESLLVESSGLETKEYVSVMASENKVVPLSTSTSGSTVRWSDFSDSCETYDFFNSYFVGIENSAEAFADRIDQVKKECGNTDYWIESSSFEEKVLLKVEANQETIYVKSEDKYEICRRYTNENADDVYEMYTRYDAGDYVYEERMLYIAGKRYEFSNNMGGYEGIYIVAENSRGYWNMFEVTDIEKNSANIMNFISDGSMAFTFDSMFAPEMPDTENCMLKFSTTDLSNDVIFLDEGSIILNLAAFNGVDYLETDASHVDFAGGQTNSIIDGQGTLVTTSGVGINNGDTFVDGAVTVRDMNASFLEDYYDQGKHRTSGQLCLGVDGDTPGQKINNVKAFLSEVGMSCRYNLDSITSKVNTAKDLATNFKNIYKWNGYSVNAYAGIENAVKVERELYSEFNQMYEEVKDLKTVSSTKFGLSFDGWDFAKISSISCGNVTLNEDTITVENMSAVVNDTAIFDKEEKYTVYLAMAKFVDGSESDYDNAVIMECADADMTSFDGGSSITLNQSASFTLPEWAATGKYTVVAYVATEDGIRVSEMVPVIFSEDISESRIHDGFKIDFSLNESKEIRMDCEIYVDVFVVLEDMKAEYTYEEMYDILSKEVLANGFAVDDAKVEKYDEANDTGQEVAADAVLSDGIYRMAYIKQTDSGEVTGYIYLDMTK